MSKPVQNDRPFLDLRVYAEYDRVHAVHVAYCLETGSVVTADDSTTTDSMIKELLEDEVSYAMEDEKRWTNLFSNPAPLEIVAKWLSAKDAGREQIIIKVKSEHLRLLFGREVNAEVRIARAA